MSIVTRAPKNGSGTPNYVADTLIEADEVNLDFNSIYDDYDGNVDNSNIAATAGIVYSKLNLTNSIVNADINANADIDGSKIADAPNGITTAKINDLAVTTAKLAIGASVRQIPTATINVGGVTSSVTETLIATLGPIAYTGSPVLIVVMWSAQVQWPTGFGTTLTIRVKRDGTPIFAPPFLGVGTGVGGVVDHLPPIICYDVVAAGTRTYTVTAEFGAANASLEVAAGGSFFAVEFA